MGTIRYTFRPDEWPRPDREAWRESQTAGDLLDPGGLAAGWAPGTLVAVTTTACGRWVGWLASRGPLDPERSAIAGMPRELMDEYVAHLRGRCAMSTVVTLLAHLVMAARAIAPSEDWSWLQRVTARLKRRSRPARDERPRLQDTDDLLDFGMELMAGAERAPAIANWRQAVDYCDGLMIVLLALRPYRRSNFCSIEIDRHLIQANTVLPFEKTKTHRPLEQIFPPDLGEALKRYLTHYRPWLCRQTGYRDPRFPFHPAGDHLWVSRSGSAFGEKGFCEALRKRTLGRFGRSLHPHLFRDCAATTIATGDPEHVRITMSVLGHATMATSERYYNHAQGVEAIRKVQSHILTLRRRAEAARRGKRRLPDAPAD